MSDDSAASSTCWGADVGGYATGSEASTDHVPYDAQTIDTIATAMSMSETGVSFVGKEVNLFSVGGEAHLSGRCKPCAFFHKQGCQNGASCIFCHQCPPHEKQRRKRLRRRMLRERFAGPAVQGHSQNFTPARGEQWGRGNGSWALHHSSPPDSAQGPPSSQVARSRNSAHPMQHGFLPPTVSMIAIAQSAEQEDVWGPMYGDQEATCSPSLLSTPPPPAVASRFVQDESSYGAPPQSPSSYGAPPQSPMNYQSGPVQYTLVPVPMAMQQSHHTSQQQQQANGVAIAVACPPWRAGMDPTCGYGDTYGDQSSMQWVNGSAAPYMCVVSPHPNGNGCEQPDLIEVPAF